MNQEADRDDLSFAYEAARQLRRSEGALDRDALEKLAAARRRALAAAIEAFGKGAGNAFGAHVVSDVPLHFLRRNAEIAKRRRHGAAGMLAGEEKARSARRVDPHDGVGIASGQHSGHVAICQTGHASRSVGRSGMGRQRGLRWRPVKEIFQS